MTGGAGLRGSRRQGPLDVLGGVLEQALGIGYEGVPPVRRPDLEAVQHPDHEGLTIEARRGPQGRGQKDPSLNVELAVHGAAGEEAGERFGGPAERGQGAQLLFEPHPFRGRIRREALVERRDHDEAGRLAEAAAEGRRHRKPALGVDPVPISPFEHSELGVFHTFFHFSTQAKRTENERTDSNGKSIGQG